MLLLDFHSVLGGGAPVDGEAVETKRAPETINALHKKKDAKLLRYLLMVCTYKGDIESVDAILKKGLSIDTAEDKTGLTPLHLAVGRNDLDMTKFLVSKGARFAPDKQGRWPTTIAAVCEVDSKLCDYIAEAEATAIKS